MNCPKCGSHRLKYLESRRKFWGGTKGLAEPSKEPRKDFRAKCNKCGWEGNINETRTETLS